MCFKEGNSSLPVPSSVRFSSLMYMRCNYTFVLNVNVCIHKQIADTAWYRFVYVSVSDGVGMALDSIVAPMSEGLGWPTQGHIALTSNDDEMLVSYVTGTLTTPSVKCDCWFIMMIQY